MRIIAGALEFGNNLSKRNLDKLTITLGLYLINRDSFAFLAAESLLKNRLPPKIKPMQVLSLAKSPIRHKNA